MKKLNIYQSRLNKKYFFLLLMLLLILSCNKIEKDKNGIVVILTKKQKLDYNTLLISLVFKNKTNTNYVMSFDPSYSLINSKQNVINPSNVDGSGATNILGKIISSDFSDEMRGWDRGRKLLYSFYKETYYKYPESDDDLYKMLIHDNERFFNGILFLPKNSDRKIILCFNSTKENHDFFCDKKTRVGANWECFQPHAEILDSLLKEAKFNFQLYKKSLILKDSLYIND